MHLLFLDESGRLDQGGLFALGGIAVRDSDWRQLKATWQQTLAAHGWPLDKELKWHGIRTGEVPPALADAVYVAIASAPFTAYVVIMDLDRGPTEFPDFFRTPEDVYANALTFAAERFHHLLAAEDDVGAIVVDSRLREDDRRLRRFFADLTEEGTPYMRLERIVEGLFLTPSQYSIGIQCADLVVAATVAGQRGIGQGSGYFKRLRRRFAVHPATGELDGVGLKRFPEPEPRRRLLGRLFRA